MKKLILKQNIILIPVIFLFFLNAQSTSTWEIIQEEIWNPNCISCHVDGSTFAFQSNLILTSDVAYSELVNVVPNNADAAADGLLRVGTEGLASLYTSFLWEKINIPDQEHFYSEHPYYGALMPLNPPSLTNGELSFIEAWIISGAPAEGSVVDTTLLEDTTRYEPPEFIPLEVPDYGMQFHVGPFDVPPNYEREFLYYEPLDGIDFMYVKSFEIAMRPGSHHFIANTFLPHITESLLPVPYEYRDIRDANGEYIIPNLFLMLFHKFGVGTQWPHVNYHFPEGIALMLDVTRGMDLNSHYVNRTDTSFVGEVYLNIHYPEEDDIENLAQVMFLNNNNFQLPPQDTTTLTKTFLVNEYAFGLPIEPVTIFQIFSHAHEHMLEFRVRIVGGNRDGELIYIAYDWEHPPILELDPPLYLDIDQGLELEATYFNWTDDTLDFGLLSEDEMMILFGYYYKESLSIITVDYLADWNLVGLPAEVIDSRYLTLFPDAEENTLYSFDITYTPDSTLVPGDGYWLMFQEAGTSIIIGTPINELTINLHAGWNLISGISEPVSVFSIIDTEGIIVEGALYSFDVNYVFAQELVPGNGYWLRAYADGEITLSSGASAKTAPRAFSLGCKTNTLTINGMDLYFGVEMSAREKLSYSLPPKPPSGAFDVRFKGDTRIAGENSEIEVMNPYENITISYDILLDASEHMNWVLTSENGKEYTLEGTGEITIPTEEIFTLKRKAIIPITYTLHQNYPNPFNPITSLRYDLPEQAQVTLTIYDLMGREITQLVNNTQEAGFKSVQWNATDSMGRPVSAGVYLYQIRADEFVQTNKMVLLK